MSFPIQLMSVFEDAPLLRGSHERVTARVSTSSSTFRPMFIVGMTILVLCSLENLVLAIFQTGARRSRRSARR